MQNALSGSIAQTLLFSFVLVHFKSLHAANNWVCLIRNSKLCTKLWKQKATQRRKYTFQRNTKISSKSKREFLQSKREFLQSKREFLQSKREFLQSKRESLQSLTNLLPLGTEHSEGLIKLTVLIISESIKHRFRVHEVYCL